MDYHSVENTVDSTSTFKLINTSSFQKKQKHVNNSVRRGPDKINLRLQNTDESQ